MNAKERELLYKSAKNIPVINKMTNWMYKVVNSDSPFAERLLRMACVEGLFFTGCFCAIYWLQSRGLMPGLGHANELISRDEALHTDFALYLYLIMENNRKLSDEKIYEIFNEAVEIAVDFIDDALPRGLSQMNSALMTEYIKVQANNLLASINVPPLYTNEKGAPISHHLLFSDKINTPNKTNFFERRPSEYSKQKNIVEVAETVNENCYQVLDYI